MKYIFRFIWFLLWASCYILYPFGLLLSYIFIFIWTLSFDKGKYPEQSWKYVEFRQFLNDSRKDESILGYDNPFDYLINRKSVYYRDLNSGEWFWIQYKK